MISIIKAPIFLWKLLRRRSADERLPRCRTLEGAAFDRRRTARRIGEKIVAQPQRRLAGGSRERLHARITGRCWIVRTAQPRVRF
jgi:hypothetical protein